MPKGQKWNRNKDREKGKRYERLLNNIQKQRISASDIKALNAEIKAYERKHGIRTNETV